MAAGSWPAGEAPRRTVTARTTQHSPFPRVWRVSSDSRMKRENGNSIHCFIRRKLDVKSLRLHTEPRDNRTGTLERDGRAVHVLYPGDRAQFRHYTSRLSRSRAARFVIKACTNKPQEQKIPKLDGKHRLKNPGEEGRRDGPLLSVSGHCVSSCCRLGG